MGIGIRVVLWCGVLAFAVASPTLSLAQTCRSSVSLLELVHTSDVIAVVQKKGFFAQPALVRSELRNSFDFHFLKVIKSLAEGDIDISKKQRVYPYRADHRKLRGERQYLMFLTLVRPGVWETRNCYYFDITDGKLVRQICSAVNDLFGDSPYERERKCLLNASGAAPLHDVELEILKKIPKDGPFRGYVRMTDPVRWSDTRRFQRVRFEVLPKYRKEFFSVEQIRSGVETQALVRTSTYSQRELEKLTREGKRVQIEGFWERGTFIIARME